MPIDITGEFQPSDGVHGFDLYDPQDIKAGNVNVALQAIAGGSFKGGSHATAPVGEIVVQTKTTTGTPTHTATEGTICWNSVDNKLFVNNNGATAWTEIGAVGRRTRICRIDSPVSGDAFQVVGIPDAATIKAVRHIHVGGTSVVFNIEHRAEATPFTTSATVVWTAPGKTTSATSTEETAFDDGTVAASIVLTVVIGTVTGSVTNMLVVIEYEVD